MVLVIPDVPQPAEMPAPPPDALPAPPPHALPEPPPLGIDHWRQYYEAATLARADAVREVFAIRSTGATLHLDVYPRPEPGAPVVVVNHGGAGYCRLFVTQALAFHDLGYTVVLPDQKGQGFSGGRRGDCTVTEATQNIVDASRWARTRYDGPVFLAGASMGGILTYYAAAAGAPVEAMACVNLADLGSPDAWELSRLAPLARSRPTRALLGGILAALARLSRPRVPLAWVARVADLMDDREPAAQAAWRRDPVPPRHVSPRYLASAVRTPPAVPLPENRIPVLVVNQARDEMIDPGITRRSYERLGGPKSYLEVPFGHWSLTPEFSGAVATAADDWFRRHAH